MIRVVIDRLFRLDHLGRAERRFASVEVAIEAREVTAGDVDANLVSGLEDVARRPQINRVFVDLARLDRLRAYGRIAVTRANDPVGQKTRVARPPFGRFCPSRWIDVNDHRGEIGVWRGSRGVKLGGDVTGDLGVAFERRSGKDQHVLPRFVRSLVERAWLNGRAAAKPPADGRRRVLRVVFISVGLLFAGLFAWRTYRKLAVAGSRIRALVRVKVIFRILRAGQRELLFVAPGVVAHHEDADWRVAREFVL